MADPVERLSLRHLRLVVAVVKEGNLVGAAHRLHLTQPAVTKALQEAEAIVGGKLFDRTNRGVLPTIFGDALVAHARLILSQLTHAGQEIADIRDGRGGRVVIGTLLAASAELLPLAIARLKTERPRLAISVIEGTNDRLLPHLRAGELDFVIGRLPGAGASEGLVQETLVRDIACVVARVGHRLSGEKKLRLADLLEERWIMPTSGTTLRCQIDLSFRAEGQEPPAVPVESVSLVTNQLLIAENEYLAIYPWALARREAEAGRVCILPVTLKATASEIGVTARDNTLLSPAARHAIACVRAVAATITPSPLAR